MGNGNAGISGMTFNLSTDNCYYSSKYNSTGLIFADTGKSDNTIKKSSAEIKSNNMVQLLGSSFFYYDSGNMLFNWEKISGFDMGRYGISNEAVACFEEETKVLTINGMVPIEQIEQGDYVLSKSEQGQIEEQMVYHTYSHNPRTSI